MDNVTHAVISAVSDDGEDDYVCPHSTQDARYSAQGDSKSVDHELWTTRPGVLFTFWKEILPFGWMSRERRINAITRLMILCALAYAFYLWRSSAWDMTPPVVATTIASATSFPTPEGHNIPHIVFMAILIAVISLILLCKWRQRCQKTSTYPSPDADWGGTAAPCDAMRGDINITPVENMGTDPGQLHAYSSTSPEITDAHERSYVRATSDVSVSDQQKDRDWIIGPVCRVANNACT